MTESAERKGLADWFAVFRTGTHTDSRGRSATFTRDDLDGMVAAYDPEQPSPCVITHKELYSPFGYANVEAFRRDGEVLQARCKPDSIEPQFAKLVEDERLNSRSIQLLPQEGGGYRVGHLAFLGAEPPAVEGLAPISFSRAGLDFSSDDPWDEVRDARNIARIFSALRRIAVKVFGEEEADSVLSDWEVQHAAEDTGAAMERARQRETGGETVTEYSQQQLDDAVAAARSEAATAAAAAAQADARNRGRIEALVNTGRITPVQSEGLAEFCAVLPAGEPLEFSRARGEGQEPEQVSAAPVDFLFSLLEALPERQIVREPIAGGEGPGREAGQSATGISAKALEFMAAERKAGRVIGIAQAVRHITGGDS